jgi:hypothetical protein
VVTVGKAVMDVEDQLNLSTTSGQPESDQRLIRLMSKRVGVALRHQRDAGRVASVLGPGQYNLWQLARGGDAAGMGEHVAPFPPRRGFAPGIR